MPSSCSDAVIAADGLAAAAACLAGGVGGAIAGLINPTAFAARVAIATGAASGMAYLTHPDCQEQQDNDDNHDDND